MERRDFVIELGITLTAAAFFDLFPSWAASGTGYFQ